MLTLRLSAARLAASAAFAIVALLGSGNASAFEGASQAAKAVELVDGDRIVFVGNTFTERDRHYGHFEAMLRTHWPGRKLTIRNLSWPGDTTNVQMRPLNFGSFEDHLTRQNPTWIFACYGMNESFAGAEGLEEFLDGYRRLLDLFDKTGARVVLLSPIRHENLGPPFPHPGEHNRNLKQYVDAIRRLAKDRRAGFVDLFHTLGSASDEPPPYPLTENGIHLTDYGYWRAADVVAEHFQWQPAPVAVRLDVSSGEYMGSGTSIAQLEIGRDAVRFQATDRMLPRPAPSDPAATTVPPEKANRLRQISGRHVIAVRGLKPGRYTLRIDGQPAITTSADGWSRGIELTDGPQFDQARELREKIRYKDMLFFHRWRAHNSEYIFGRRSQTSDGYTQTEARGNSGNPAFPREMAKLDRLLEQTDRELDEFSRPRPHNYELIAE